MVESGCLECHFDGLLRWTENLMRSFWRLISFWSASNQSINFLNSAFKTTCRIYEFVLMDGMDNNIVYKLGDNRSIFQFFPNIFFWIVEWETQVLKVLSWYKLNWYKLDHGIVFYLYNKKINPWKILITTDVRNIDWNSFNFDKLLFVFLTVKTICT